MKNKLSTLAAAGLMIAAGSAAAQDGMAKWYVGGSLGLTNFNSGLEKAGANTSIDEEDSGFKFLAGYKFNEQIGAEVFYADFGTAAVKNGDYTFRGSTYTLGGGSSQDLEFKAYGAGLIGFIPVTDIWSLHARLGLNRWDTELVGIEGDSDIDYYGGVGTEVMVNPQLGVSLDAERYSYDSEYVNYLSAGLNLHF